MTLGLGTVSLFTFRDGLRADWRNTIESLGETMDSKRVALPSINDGDRIIQGKYGPLQSPRRAARRPGDVFAAVVLGLGIGIIFVIATLLFFGGKH